MGRWPGTDGRYILRHVTAVYVDLDDVLAETGRMFLRVLEERFGRRVRFEELTSYHLGETLGLDAAELAAFLEAAHEPAALAAVEPMAGGAEVLQGWLDRGYRVLVVTGRPPATREATLGWLARHRIPFTEFHFLDKYSRYYDGAHGTPEGALVLTDLPALDLCLAVEDFPEISHHLADELGIPVALFDRPWNRDLAAGDRIVRCGGWREIGERFPRP